MEHICKSNAAQPSEIICDFFSLRKSVRLGEYNIGKRVDCIREENSTKIACSDSYIDIAVDKILTVNITNNIYLSASSRNDIALIRLAEDVGYTDYIFPICIPQEKAESGLVVGGKLLAAGWGLTDFCKQMAIRIGVHCRP